MKIFKKKKTTTKKRFNGERQYLKQNLFSGINSAGKK
jgi:hypothetical protein